MPKTFYLKKQKTMDNQRCDGSTVPGKDLELENRKLKEEIESLKSKQAEQEVEKLKLENLILKLEKENHENLKKMENFQDDEMKDYEETKEENKMLKEEVEGLKTVRDHFKSEYQLLNQKPIATKANLSEINTKTDRLIKGVSRFIEGIEPKTKEYDSYAQWYDDVLEKMEDHDYIICNSQKYLLS